MAEGNIYEKLRNVQIELKAPKGQYNSFAKYYYRSAEDIIEAVKPVLDKHGLTLVVTDEVENVGDRYYVRASAIVFDGTYGEDGRDDRYVSSYGWAREDEDKKGMDGAQITGAASSYARKYALNGLFAIDDTKDADTDEHKAQTAPTKATRPAVGTTETKPAAKAPLATEAQVKLLMARARDVWGINDRVELLDEFLAKFGVMPNEVERADVDAVLAQIQEAS